MSVRLNPDKETVKEIRKKLKDNKYSRIQGSDAVICQANHYGQKSQQRGKNAFPVSNRKYI